MHPMELIGDVARVEARFVSFGDSANLDIDSCTVSTKHTIGLETFCMHKMELLGDVCHVESHFGPFGDSVIIRAR
jgi:hypothetical protein